MDEDKPQGDEPPPLPAATNEEDLVPPIKEEWRGRADLAAFFGPNAERFLAVATSGRRLWGWQCWPGFLFPPAWFMYRKMYGWAALVCALPILADVLNFGKFQGVLMSTPSFIGFVGRRLYVSEAMGTVARIRSASRDLPEEEVRRALARAGGVSEAGSFVGGAIVVCAVIASFVAARHGASPSGQ